MRLGSVMGEPSLRLCTQPAGIGRPEKFYASLAAIEAPVGKTVGFADHYRYGEADAERLIAHADAAGLRLVTTEKDMARLAGESGALARLRERAEAFPVVLEFDMVQPDGVQLRSRTCYDEQAAIIQQQTGAQTCRHKSRIHACQWAV